MTYKQLLSEPAVQIIGAVVAALLTLEVWQTKAISAVQIEQSVQAEKIQHIDKAVNNAGEGEATLRELVQQNQLTLEYLRGRFSTLPDDFFEDGP